MEGVDIKYIVGDVTFPQCDGSSDAIVVHCVGKGVHRGEGERGGE